MKDSSSDRLKRIAHGLPIWIQMPVRLPFWFLFVYESIQFWREKEKNVSATSCQSVSIIIPALNEINRIVQCIHSVSGNPHVLEIIVVDGGSDDQTRRLAEEAGARVILHDRSIEDGGGRGGQIRAGIDAAGGDVVAIVHADAVLPAGDIDRMIAVMNKHPGVIGGAVGGRFDSSRLRFRLLELANDFRAAFLKISFGDQVQFFRRQPVVARDLFPAIPLMEDVELAVRLRRLGQTVYLFGGARVSTRRWEKVGGRNALWVIGQVSAYLLRRLWSEPDTVSLYRKYYQK